jgi:hypothetical protein
MKLIRAHNRDPMEVIDINDDDNDDKGHAWLTTLALKQSVCGFPLL